MRSLCLKKEEEVGEAFGEEHKAGSGHRRDKGKSEGSRERMNLGECLYSQVTLNKGIFWLLVPPSIHSKKIH